MKQTAWKGRHKIQDGWESGEYQVVGQPTPGVLVYTVKSVAGGRTRVLHKNLLLPLQGRSGSKVGQRERASQALKIRKRAEMRCPRWLGLPGRGPRRTTKPKSSPTQQQEASVVKDASADLKASLITTPSSRESMSRDEDGSEEEMYTDSLTSHTTASDSTSSDLLTSAASAGEDISSIPPSVTESHFSSIMPYLEESTQPDQAHDSVFYRTIKPTI